MNFVSLQQLERDVKAWAQNIPPFDRVCGGEWRLL